MTRVIAAALLVVIAASVAVMWVTAKWATSVPEAGVLILAVISTTRPILRRDSAVFATVLLAVTGIIFWGGIQLLAGTSVYPHQTWLAILYWAGNLAALFVSMQIFGDARTRRQFLQWLIWFGFVVCIVSSVQALMGSTKIYGVFETEYEGWVLLGPFVYHNQFAAFIELLLPIALYFSFVEQGARSLYILIAATMYASVIVAASRAGLILTTAELVLVPWLMTRRTNIPARQVVIGIVFLGAMVTTLALAAGPEVIARRFGLRDPFAIRREFLISSLQMFRQKPWLGVGLGNWSTAYPGYALYDDGLFANQAHNDWAQWAVEGGIPLLALMSWLFCWTARHGTRTIWGIGVLAVFLHCAVDYPIQRMAVAILFFTVIGAVACASGAHDFKQESDGLGRQNGVTKTRYAC